MTTKQTDYEKVLEWLGWEQVNYSEAGGRSTYHPLDDDDYSLAFPADFALADPDLQARYFDPYILEKGYHIYTFQSSEYCNCEICRPKDSDPEIITEVYLGVDKKELALAKREAYRKLAEVGK